MKPRNRRIPGYGAGGHGAGHGAARQPAFELTAVLEDSTKAAVHGNNEGRTVTK